MRNQIVCAGLLIASTSSAAEITLLSPDPVPMINPVFHETMEGIMLGASDVTLTPRFHIHISGPIVTGDAEEFLRIFHETATELPFHGGVVSFDSLGGSFAEGLALGDVIYDWSIPTLVLPGDACLSACALAFLAGAEEVIRGVQRDPARQVFIGSDFGLHAPFLSEDSMRARAGDYLTTDDGIGDTVAFAQAMFQASRDLVRELNDRAERWSVSPALISEFLGYGPEEYYRIDSLERARRASIDVVVPEIARPASLALPDVLGACDHAFYLRLSEFYDGRPGFAIGPNDRDASQAEPVWFPTGSFVDLEVGVSSDPVPIRITDRSYSIAYFIPGRGNYECTVTRGQVGWSVDLQGDYHPDRALGRPVANLGPILVNALTIAGAAGAWTMEGFERELRNYTTERLRFIWPDDLARRLGREIPELKPSYSCDGKLTRTERLICDNVSLAYLDTLLAEAFAAARESDAAFVDQQRSWLRARDAICMPDAADWSLEPARVNQARCLSGAMITQIETLRSGEVRQSPCRGASFC